MTVTLEMDGKTAVITLDDGKANAVGHALLEALEPALAKAETDADAIVLAGRPGKFSAGFDLRTMQGASPEEVQALVNRGGHMALALFRCSKPLIAAATGHGIALGAIWLLASDERIGTPGPFKFGLNETAIGMALPVFGLELARARVPAERQTEAVIMGQLYGPEEACNAGYLDELVAEDKLLERCLERAAMLGALPGRAYAANKRALRAASIATIEASLAP